MILLRVENLKNYFILNWINCRYKVDQELDFIHFAKLTYFIDRWVYQLSVTMAVNTPITLQYTVGKG